MDFYNFLILTAFEMEWDLPKRIRGTKYYL